MNDRDAPDEPTGNSSTRQPYDCVAGTDRSHDESWRDIRPVALGVVRRGDELLVFEMRDETAGETFYRPPGGGIHFGEPAADAVAREFEEELGWTVAVEERLAVLENVFRFEGTLGHEYDVVFAVDPADDAVFSRDEFVGTESSGEEYPVRFEHLDDFEGADAPPLYPDGLLDVLR